MDAENIDFVTLVDGIQELFGKACVLLNVPLGHGADFRAWPARSSRRPTPAGP